MGKYYEYLLWFTMIFCENNFSKSKVSKSPINMPQSPPEYGRGGEKEENYFC